jgi:hypothetical protein
MQQIVPLVNIHYKYFIAFLFIKFQSSNAESNGRQKRDLYTDVSFFKFNSLLLIPLYIHS